jgi:hypothetical protein
MKNLIIIILGLFCITIKAQNLNKISSQNVYFIYFDDNEFTKKGCNTTKNDTSCAYYFYDTDKKIFKFSFYYSKFPTFDDAHNNINAAMVYKLNKSFLRKNKNIIITREFMEQLGEKNVIKLLYGINKQIFLIDKSEIKDGKITLREVRFDFPYEI